MRASIEDFGCIVAVFVGCDITMISVYSEVSQFDPRALVSVNVSFKTGAIGLRISQM